MKRWFFWAIFFIVLGFIAGALIGGKSSYIQEIIQNAHSIDTGKFKEKLPDINTKKFKEKLPNIDVEKTAEKLADADFAISNMGGVRSDIAAGEITYRDVFNVLPFGNAVVAYDVSGKVLKDVVAQVAGRHHGLLISGGTVIYSRSRHTTNPIVEMTIGGKPVQADTKYWLTLSDYLLDAYGLAELQKLPDADVRHTYTTIHDALAKYISEHSPIVPKADGRWETIK